MNGQPEVERGDGAEAYKLDRAANPQDPVPEELQGIEHADERTGLYARLLFIVD